MTEEIVIEALRLVAESHKQALNDALLRAVQAEELASKFTEQLDPAKITEYIVNIIRGHGETLVASRLVAHQNVLEATKLAIDALVTRHEIFSKDQLVANLIEIQKSLTLTTKE